MAVTNEEKRFYDIYNAAPSAVNSGQTAQSAAAVAAAEQAAQQQAAGTNYGNTADARLDRAIAAALSQSGYNYDINNDAAYRDFAREYSQNMARGREQSRATAATLANGYDPTYTDAVASGVGGELAGGYARYAPQFAQLAKQEAAAKQNQAMNAAEIYKAMGDTRYSRAHDTLTDKTALAAYLQSRYGADRQADMQRTQAATDVWKTRLSGAQDDLNTARSFDNKMYQYLSQSENSRAKIAEDNYEAEQKLNYTAAKDEYDARVAAEKAAAKAAQEAAKAAQKAAKEQAKAEKEQAKEDEKHKKNAWKINNYLVDNYKLSQSDRYDLDYNGDGKIDTRDAVLAQKAMSNSNASSSAAGSDEDESVTFENDQHTQDFIKHIKDIKHRSRSSMQDVAKAWLEKHQNELSDGQSAYLYQYFGL